MGQGVYNVTGIDMATCTFRSSLQAGLTVMSTEPFQKPVISGNTTIECGATTILSAPTGYFRYDWMLNNSVVQSGTQNTINANTFGEGVYTVRVTDIIGCSNTSTNHRITQVRPTINSVQQNPLGVSFPENGPIKIREIVKII